jgi:hypothetical protein
VFFKNTSGYVFHAGMYVGDHKFIEAPRTGETVRYADLRDSYWSSQFAGGRRVVPLDATGAAPAGTAAAPGAVSIAAATPATPAGAASPAAAAGAATPGAAAPGAGAAQATPQAPLERAVPGTSTFRALERQERAYHRHTVQFLKAIQPSELQPATAAPAGSAPPTASGAVTPAATPGAGGQIPGQVLGSAPPVAAAQTPGAGLAEQVSATGAPAPAGAFTVSSSILTSGQETFVAHLSQLTGLPPRVVAAWCLAEESGSAAQGRQAANNFNWLNIGYFDSGAGSIAFDKEFGDPVSAAEQTAKFLKGEWGGASTGIRDILHSVGKPPDQQFQAIANSGWASSRYNDGANLRSTFDELQNMKITPASPVAPAGAVAPASPTTPA